MSSFHIKYSFLHSFTLRVMKSLFPVIAHKFYLMNYYNFNENAILYLISFVVYGDIKYILTSVD